MPKYASAYRKPPGTMNKAETAYCAHLEALKKSGDVLDYSFEIETLKLGKDCRFTPDFRVMRSVDNQILIEFHEVKAAWGKSDKPHVEDDALVKIKTAAEMHPYKFIIVWWNKGSSQWMKREIN